MMVKVSQVMSKAVIIDGNTVLKEAAKIISKNNRGVLVVVKNNKIVGILTEKDILRNISNLNRKVKQVMNKKVISVSDNDDVKAAGELMAQYKIKRLPVVKNGRLVGAINFTDVIGHSEFGESDDFLLN